MNAMEWNGMNAMEWNGMNAMDIISGNKIPAIIYNNNDSDS